MNVSTYTGGMHACLCLLLVLVTRATIPTMRNRRISPPTTPPTTDSMMSRSRILEVFCSPLPQSSLLLCSCRHSVCSYWDRQVGGSTRSRLVPPMSMLEVSATQQLKASSMPLDSEPLLNCRNTITTLSEPSPVKVLMFVKMMSRICPSRVMFRKTCVEIIWDSLIYGKRRYKTTDKSLLLSTTNNVYFVQIYLLFPLHPPAGSKAEWYLQDM